MVHISIHGFLNESNLLLSTIGIVISVSFMKTNICSFDTHYMEMGVCYSVGFSGQCYASTNTLVIEIYITLRCGVLLDWVAPTAALLLTVSLALLLFFFLVNFSIGLPDSVSFLIGIVLHLWVYLGAVDILMALRYFNINREQVMPLFSCLFSCLWERTF